MSSDTHGWLAKAADAGVLTAKKADLTLHRAPGDGRSSNGNPR